MPKFIADLHIHSKYSRATSPKMNLEDLDCFADDKGILVMATGDFTHPLWIKEIKTKLEPAEQGLYKLKNGFKKPTLKGTFADTRFILSVEIASIYSKGGKCRRIHNLVFAPNIETAEKINAQLSKIGNLKSDGRPILGLDSEKLAEIVFNINPEAAIIPAHCLLPNTVVHTKDDLLKPIQNVKEGDYVITHNNRWRKVQKVFKRPYNGKIYHIKPRNFSLGLTTTFEHPFYAIKTHKNCHWSKGICKPSHIDFKNCKNKYFKDYKPQWVMANQLERGDVLIFPRFKNIFENHKEIDLKEITNRSDLATEIRGEFIVPIGNKITAIKQKITIDKNLCKLAGYYLAEGYTNSRDLIGFAFSDNEKEYVGEVINLMKKVFGFDKTPKFKTNRSSGIEILFYSKILCETFRRLFYSSAKIQNASTKALPYWALGLPSNLQVEIFRCWWRGDTGYTASRLLMNQVKIILLRLGIIPSIYLDTRENYNGRKKHFIGARKIKARYGMYSLNRLSFFEDKFNLLKEPEFAGVAKYNHGKKYGWIDENYIYLPIYNIETKNYKGEVYNLEIEEDNSYITEFATVHNCWTPWFSVFGSMSGFDSIEECFGKYAKNIFAIETGLSSDPAMNWQVSKLDNVALISNSDSHSLEKIGREANIFYTKLSYNGIMEAIKSGAPQEREKRKKKKEKFAATIEFFPEEGRYHYDGHSDCKISLHPDETKKYNGICPKCKKPLVIGVMNRVKKLGDRKISDIIRHKSLEISSLAPDESKLSPADLLEIIKIEVKNNLSSYNNRVPFYNLVGLNKIIAEVFGCGENTKKVKTEYQNLIKKFDNELKILMEITDNELKSATNIKIAEGIKRVRERNLTIKPGYDGQYGQIKIFNEKDEKIS